MTYLYTGLLFTGIAITFLSLWFYSNSQRLLEKGTITDGVVIELIRSTSNDGNMYKPVFEYTDRANTKITFKSSFSSSPAPYKIGDKVKIVYMPDNKTQKIITFWGLYRWTIILLCIASPMLIIGGGYLLYIRG